MKKNKATTKNDKAKAAEYYALALQHEQKREYQQAYEYYKQSLQLHPDKTVEKAYQHLLATIGPM